MSALRAMMEMMMTTDRVLRLEQQQADAALPPPDLDGRCERLKAARARFLAAVAAELAVIHTHGEYAPAVRTWLQAAEDTVHNHLEPEIAYAQREADEDAAEAEAAEIGRASRAHLHSVGVAYGRQG